MVINYSSTSTIWFSRRVEVFLYADMVGIGRCRVYCSSSLFILMINKQDICLTLQVIERFSMTSTANGKRQIHVYVFSK